MNFHCYPTFFCGDVVDVLKRNDESVNVCLPFFRSQGTHNIHGYHFEHWYLLADILNMLMGLAHCKWSTWWPSVHVYLSQVHD